jgi:hypothetical protein
MILILIFGLLIISSSEAFIASQIANQEASRSMGFIEQTKITSVNFISDNSATIKIYNSGLNSVVVSCAVVNQNKATLDTCEAPLGIPKNKSANFIVTLQNGSEFIQNQQSQFKIITAKGNTMNYNATYNSSITVMPSHIHSQNPLLPPVKPDLGKVSMFGFGWATTSSLIVGITAFIYSSVAGFLLLVNRRNTLPKELILLFLVGGDILLLPPVEWLSNNFFSFSSVSFQALLILMTIFLLFCACNIGKLLYHHKRGKAATFFFLLVMTLFFSFVTAIGIDFASYPMPIG